MRYAARPVVHYRKTLIFTILCRHFMGLNSSKMSTNEPIIVAASEKATASVIFLHGLGDTGHGWAAGFDEIKVPHIRYIFPNAPIQPVTLNGGMAMPSWFDIRSLSFAGPEDAEGVAKSSKMLLSLVEKEEKSGIPLNRIMIGGFSQGGAVALYAAITSAKELGGILALSTWLPQHKEIVKCPPVAGLNILQCHGTIDPVVNYVFGEMTAKVLKPRYPNHIFNSYDNMGHSSSQKEMEDVKAFIAKVLPKV